MNQTTSFHYSRNYGSVTLVIMFKVAVKMSDPSCLLEKARTLNHVINIPNPWAYLGGVSGPAPRVIKGAPKRKNKKKETERKRETKKGRKNQDKKKEKRKKEKRKTERKKKERKKEGKIERKKERKKE